MQLAIVKHPVRSNKNCVADSNNFLTAITLPPGCIGTTSFPGDLNAGTYLSVAVTGVKRGLLPRVIP